MEPEKSNEFALSTPMVWRDDWVGRWGDRTGSTDVGHLDIFGHYFISLDSFLTSSDYFIKE
jgi:hypothetical protein